MKITVSLILLIFIKVGNAQNIPLGGIEILATKPMEGFRLSVSSGKGEAIRDTLTDSMTTNASVVLKTIEAPKTMWDIQYSAPSERSVEANDQMLLVFSARMISTKDETGQGIVTCVFEKAGPDYDKALYRSVNLDNEWRQYFFPFKMDKSYLPGQAQLNFQIGTSKQQVIELSNVSLLNFKKGKTESELPKTEYSYKGREADASWRKLADENIDNYRKADVVFLIKDKKGLPLKGVEISIDMKKHSFGWGTCIDANTFLSNAVYKDKFYKNFNKAVFENDLKWPEWNNTFSRPKTITALNELNNRKIPVRGHCLVWPSWRWLPSDLKQNDKNPAVLKELILSHIKEETETLGDKIAEWDVFNEPYTNTDIQTICGDEVMPTWFTETKKYTTTAKLYINDFSILSGGGNDIAHQDHYYNTIKYIKEAGAPIEGIGFQSHFSWILTSPEVIWKLLDRYSTFGLDMQVTEFDIDIDDEQLQADYTRDFMTAIFAYPTMKGFMIWGFWANRHWKPNGAMYRSNWTEKPNLKVWNDLIYKTWWTNEKALTDETGRIAFRGFHGDYNFTMKDHKGNIIGTGEFTLDERGKVFTLNNK